MHASSSGPVAGHEGSGYHRPTPSPIKEATRGIDTKVVETEQTTQDLLEYRHADKRLTDQLTKSALIARGDMALDASGQVLPSATEQALVDPTTAQRNQAIAIGLELAISAGWTTIFHQDIDPLVLAGGVGFIIAAGQAITTKINNRKRA